MCGTPRSLPIFAACSVIERRVGQSASGTNPPVFRMFAIDE